MMDKATLLDMLRDNRALFEKTLANVGVTRMVEPLKADQLTGKDIVAHITTWEQRLIGWLKATAEGKTPERPEPGVTWDDLDSLNERTLARDRDRSLQEVMENSQRSFQQLLAQVQVFSEEELTDPQRFAWTRGAPLWQRVVAGPGYGHYQAHLYDLLQLTDPGYWFKPDPTLLTKYFGTYTDADGDSVKARLEGNQLVFTLPRPEGEREATTMAVDTTRFAYENGGVVEFLIGNDGGPEAVRWWGLIFSRNESKETMMTQNKHLVETPRLQLIPFSLDLMKATLTGDIRRGEIPGVAVPDSWPGSDLAEALPVFIAHMEKDATDFAWNWLIIHKRECVVVGDIGFMGGPNAEGSAEIGYSIVPEARKQGYATEAARGLIHWAFQQQEIKIVTAECLSDNIGSIKVLERVGMRQLEPEDKMLKWEIRQEK